MIHIFKPPLKMRAYLKSNRLLEPIQEYEKREEEGGRGGERMRSDLDVSCGNT
jgi:hypothetical protein